MTALQIIFLIVGAATLATAMMVVLSSNLIHAALWLIGTLFFVAVLFVLLEAGFLAAVQVVLYIGAIAVMIIIGAMLTRRVMQDTGPQINSQWWVGALVAVIAFGALTAILLQTPFAASGAVPAPDNLTDLGRALVDPNRFVVPFEVASVLLIGALVGSIVIVGERE
jgi:NADH-quinone oxidoreductase subunit J